MESKMQLLRVRNFSDVINDTLAFIKLNIKPFGKVVLFLVLPILIIGSYFFSSYFNAISSIMGNHDPYAIKSAMAHSAGSILLGYLGLFLASMCLYLAIIQLLLKYEASDTGQIEAQDIFDGIKAAFFPFLGFSIVLGIIVSVAIALIIIIVALLADAGGFGAAAFLGFILFLAAMYGFVALCFSPFVYMRERNGILNSLSRSFFLIKGYWWQTFGVIIVVYMIMYFASLIFIIPFYAMFFGKMLHSISSTGQAYENSAWSTVSLIFMMCGVTIMSSLIYIAIFIQYYSLVERKEGENIMQQIENIGSSENSVG